jgi:glycosyltransferase involved in cell wall biosynthesis
MRSKLGPGAVRIAYCGPIAQPRRPARGGYESANRRLIDDLRRRGADVLEFAYPLALGSKFAKGVAYSRHFAAIALELVQQRRRFDILHLTPLYRQFIYAEALLCLVAWSLGKRVMLDIRAGSFIQHYQDRSPAYRKLVDALMARADILAVEGREMIPFAKTRHERPILYLPNYVNPRADQARPSAKQRGDTIRIVFLGRVVPEKGIETAIAAIEALQDRGLRTQFEVIGDGDPDYMNALKRRTVNLPVTWRGSLPPEAIRTGLAAAHFFIFPTRHFGEGHSNALTEAMAEGVVPVCSAHGFNCSVVAETGGVLSHDASAADYADAIATIWANGSWPELSATAQKRVARHFTGDVVVSDLIGCYAGIPTLSNA